jgi:hypothetical protein
MLRIIIILLSLLLAFVSSSTIAPSLIVQFDANYPNTTETRIVFLLQKASSNFQFQQIAANDNVNIDTLAQGSIILAFGNTFYANKIINANQLEGLGSEGFIVNGSVTAVGEAATGIDYPTRLYWRSNGGHYGNSIEDLLEMPCSV